MSRRSPRLQFTKEELENPAIQKAAKKAEKAQDRLEQAEARLPKKTLRKRTVDPKTGAVTTKLITEEKKPPSSRLSDTIKNAPASVISRQVHRRIREEESENTGLEAAHRGEELSEGGVRTAEAALHHARLRPYRAAQRAESKADRANLNALYEKSRQETPPPSGNARSRWQQKRAIRKKYAEAKRAGTDTIQVSELSRSASRAVENGKKKAAHFVVRHRKVFLLLLVLALFVVILSNTLSSCSVLMESGISAIGIATYPSEDADMTAAEARYCQMEAELQEKLDNYEDTHTYDEYRYDLDEIKHDPYVLMSLLTAMRGGAWTMDEVETTLQRLFKQQYILTETVSVKTKYRDGEPYTYTICTVKLENRDLSHLPSAILSEEQLSLYSVYMATLGNREDLFTDSEYIERYITKGYTDYAIPTAALQDETFAAMIREGEKYLGYPYVWGGASPSTSFDCSGFVSWVINHSGWNVGRQTAQGLCNLCTKTSTPHPGDLVFFKGTYQTNGVSHVGIYVGNQMMLHCGDPISYSNLNSSYWKQHFYCYGRLP